MIMFTLILITLLLATIVSAIALLLGGVGIFAVFGDVIVFGLIVYALIRIFRRRK